MADFIKISLTFVWIASLCGITVLYAKSYSPPFHPPSPSCNPWLLYFTLAHSNPTAGSKLTLDATRKTYAICKTLGPNERVRITCHMVSGEIQCSKVQR